MSLKKGDKVVLMDARFPSNVRYDVGEVVAVLDKSNTYSVQDSSLSGTRWRVTDNASHIATELGGERWYVSPLQQAEDIAHHILEQVGEYLLSPTAIEGSKEDRIIPNVPDDIGYSSETSHCDTYHSSHYAKHPLQPIELMQMILSPAEFIGFLKGNIIKYADRAGNKAGEPVEKEMSKIKRYKEWLDKAAKGEIINPRV